MPRTSQAPAHKRADAQRNIEAILDAAVVCLSHNPEASVGEIAKAAGVGRVTLYGHFPSRADLVDAVFTRTVEHADAALDALDIGGDPRRALVRLITTTWPMIDRARAIRAAALTALPPERIHAAHEGPMRRVQRLVERGQDEGVFRTDLPASWLVGVLLNVMHGAADEITAGRLVAGDAAGLIAATILAAYTAPGCQVPKAG
ncbi:MAG TPA: TetR/AcrR family transcriptional regulator [Kribbellaceae bacterium]|jgi:AcrR family transcriptional regulator